MNDSSATTTKFQRSLQLTKSAWRVLKLDKELLMLPVIGSLLSILLVAGFGAATFAVAFGFKKSEIIGSEVSFSSEIPTPLWLGVTFVFIFLVSLVANFISGAIVHGALERFNGNNPTIRGSITAARRHFKPLVLFSLLATTVGLILQLIQERLPFAGKIINWLGGMAWSVATLFALPFIMQSDTSVGPIDATKQSTQLVKKVWGESLLVSAGLGIVGFLGVVSYMLVASLAVGLSSMGGTVVFGVAGLVAVIGLLVIVLVLSVLSSIARTAVFYWATTGKSPESFNQELLRSALTVKKARKIFG